MERVNVSSLTRGVAAKDEVYSPYLYIENSQQLSSAAPSEVTAKKNSKNKIIAWGRTRAKRAKKREPTTLDTSNIKHKKNRGAATAVHLQLRPSSLQRQKYHHVGEHKNKKGKRENANNNKK